MRRIGHGVVLAAVAATGLVLAMAQPAAAHDERPTRTLSGQGHQPAYRIFGPTLLVCKTDKADFDRRSAAFPSDLKATNQRLWADCQKDGYRDLQAAVDAVTQPGVTIKMLPGVYHELPSLAPATGPCANLTGLRKSALYHYDVLTLQQQIDCPHNQNLVAIIHKTDLQVEGTGAAPTDVVVDAQYAKLNTIRADNSDGIYFRNLTAQRSQFNAFYIMETDGFVIDRAVGRWNDEYGFLTFAVDHGLYTHAEGYGNGGLEHQQGPCLRRAEVCRGDPRQLRPRQLARLLRHSRRLGVGPRQRLHEQHHRHLDRQRLPRPPRDAAEPLEVRAQRHREQQPRLLPLLQGRHLPPPVCAARV
jgi:hypothetical protein